MHQGNQKAGTGRAHGVALGARAAVDVDFLRVQAEFADRHHGDHGEGLVDLEQIHIVLCPAGFTEQGLDGTHRCAGELRWMLGLGAVGDDPGQRLETTLLGFGFPHQNQGRGAVGYGRGIGGSDGAVFTERGAQARYLFDIGVVGLLIIFNNHLALTGFHGYGDDFVFEQSLFNGLLRPGERGDGEFVHLFTGIAFLVRHFLGESPHQAASLCVFQAIEEHVILGRLPRTHPVPAADSLEDVGGVGHALHAAGNHDVVAASLDYIVGKHGRFHAGPTEFVNSGSTGAVRKPCLTHGLAGRALFEAGG